MRQPSTPQFLSLPRENLVWTSEAATTLATILRCRRIGRRPEYRFSPGLVTGVALGWAYSHFSTSGISGAGDLSTFAVTPYARYAPGAWYVEGAVGGGWNDASVSRNIVFPGVSRHANGSPEGSAFLSQAETGYRLDLGPQMRVTPFASLQGVVFDQDAFTETGAGAINLHVQDESTSSAYGVLGTKLAYALPAVLAAPSRGQRARRLGAGIRRH